MVTSSLWTSSLRNLVEVVHNFGICVSKIIMSGDSVNYDKSLYCRLCEVGFRSIPVNAWLASFVKIWTQCHNQKFFSWRGGRGLLSDVLSGDPSFRTFRMK